MSPGFSKQDHFFSKYYAWHGTSKYFVGTVTCHSLCASRDYYRSPLDRNCLQIEMGVWLVVGATPVARPRPGPMLVNKVGQYCYYIQNAPELISERVRIQKFPDPHPNKSFTLCAPYTSYFDHYSLSCSGPVDTFLAQKR